MIHSRVLWMLRPVERSITVSAPQRIAHTIFSTSSSTDEVTAELPMLALILVRKLRPMTIGSSSAWLMLHGMMARPRAISSRTNSGVTNSGTEAPKLSPSSRAASARSSCCLAAEVLALGDVDHLLGDDAGAGEFELRDRLAVERRAAAGSTVGKSRAACLPETLPLSSALIARPSYSSTPPRSRTHSMRRAREALLDVDRDIGVGVGAGGVVDRQRRLAGGFRQARSRAPARAGRARISGRA